MNAPTLALHGKVAATVVSMVGDPTLTWRDASTAALDSGDERMAALFDGLATFAEWGHALARVGNIVDSVGVEPDTSTEGPT